MTDTTTEQTGTEPGAGAEQTQSPGSTEAGAGGKGGKAQTPAATGKEAGAQGSDAPWYDGLPDDLKGQGHVTRHASVEDAVRALIGAEKRLGVPADQLIRKPTKDEDYADVYRALGAPEKPEDYGIGLPENATDDDKALAQRFAQVMFDKGPFPPQMVQAAVEFINGETLAADEALKAAGEARRTETETLLKKELGQAYDPDLKAVGKLLNDLGGEELKAELDASGLGDNPRLIMAFHKVIERLGESQTVHGQGSGVSGLGGMTPGQAKAARLNLENDPIKGAALRDASHAMHKTVLEERRRYLEAEQG